jgi:hypothetical protein
MPCIAVVLPYGGGMRLAGNVALCREHFGEGIPVIGVKNALFQMLDFVIEPPECSSITTACNPGNSSP